MTHAFARAALRRVAATVGFVALVATAAFVLTRLAPGDPTLALRASGASEAVIAHERARRGLDQPLTALAADWLRGALRGDLGESVTYGRPVRTLVAERAVYTAQLAAGALIVALIIGVPLGILGGAYPRHWASRLSATLSLALVSCPPMVAALALLWIAATTQWMSMEPGAWVLPTLALGVPLAASIERLQSQAVREAMGGLEVVAAAARGIPPARLLWIHVARQSLRPLLGIFGVVIGSLFSGSLIVEVVTSWPGLGRLTYDALRERDIYLVAGCAMAGAVCLSAGQCIADAARTWADPRVRTPR